jgi:uncharacterized damage-inducible protein DinB
MSTRQFFLERRKSELPVFLKVLRALPADRLEYRPHERSPSAEQVVWTLTNELRSCVQAAREGRAEWRIEPAPGLDRMIEIFEQNYQELMSIVEDMDDTAWDRPAQFFFNGKMVSEQPVSQFLWMILFDAIHHRGQLTAYLRPMGGKVPAIYGPSADTRS